MEGLVVMILLVDSSLECDFVSFYQTIIMPAQVVLSFLSQFASGIFTDQTAPYANRILQFTCLFCLVVDAVMFLWGSWSKWLLLALFGLRFTSLVQLNNSVGKVLKLHLARSTVPEEEQLPIIANVSVVSDCAGRIFAVLFGFGLPLLLIQYADAGFYTIKYSSFTTIFALDCCAFTTSLFIPTSYISGPERETTEFKEGDDLLEAASKSQVTKCCKSIVKSFVKFFRHRFVWNLTFQISLGMLVMAMLTVVMRFELASVPETDQQPDRSNLCNLYLRNLLLQDGVGDTIRAFSAIFYQFVLTDMRPWYFYSRAWYLMTGIVGLLVASTFWSDMPASLGSIVLGLLLSIIYMLLVFSNSTIAAVVPEEIYGLTFAIQGALNTLVLLIPSGLSALEMPRFAITIITLSLIGIQVFWTIGVVYMNKEAIIKLDKDTPAKSRIASCIWGYDIKYETLGAESEEELGSD
eukprot:TRINITY_DN11280_c0_g1_i1.p1 TRINITY_DN11280_c0_g1~~TRINITY_DN11280_c0_g1_i1.p1  ORF type:complete len:518 (-),score=61.18 TRINITY_DN11280_c0_g1_i1:68-1462(-)